VTMNSAVRPEGDDQVRNGASQGNTMCLVCAVAQGFQWGDGLTTRITVRFSDFLSMTKG
jgi:hypothetical protein